MKILYVITDLAVGGVPLHLHRVSTAMKGRGHVPVVVSLAPAGPVADRIRQAGIVVRSCSARHRRDLGVIRRLSRILREERPDLVHALLFHANFAARRAARNAGFPADRVLCEIQTVEVERRWHLWVDRWTYRGCRWIIGNAPSVVEHLHRRAGIPRDRLRLVRGGIDPRRIEQAEPIDRCALDVPTGVPLIVWTGRLDAVKGLPFLVEAVARLERDPPPHLLLVGDGPMREPIREQVRRLGVEDRVHLAGLRDDVPGILKSADLFTFPSRTEGLPNALLEAMAAALPVVATDVPGCRDLIEHERTGLLVPYGDTPALCDALRRLLEEPSLARRLGKAAAREVSTSWHLDRTFDAYEALYREAMQPPSR